MNTNIHTILGSTGVIGTEVAKSLTAYNRRIRLVSRNPKPVNSSDELAQADLLNESEVIKAVKGSEVVYLTAGLPYRTDVWRLQWPAIMRSVIKACKETEARFVFFDNVYMYGRVEGWMTEDTPVNPCSRKGKIRAEIAGMILEEISKGSLTALIARAADFYGPRSIGVPTLMVFNNLAKGSKPQCLISDKTKHVYTYTPDAGRATALLGNTENAFNQIWHLPSDKNALTAAEFIRLASEAFNTNGGYAVLPKWMLKIAGLFNSDIHESYEMAYQLEYDYLFDSGKFEKAFNFEPTTYLKGIKETVESYKQASL